MNDTDTLLKVWHTYELCTEEACGCTAQKGYVAAQRLAKRLAMLRSALYGAVEYLEHDGQCSIFGRLNSVECDCGYAAMIQKVDAALAE